jgi:hypothetical protein
LSLKVVYGSWTRINPFPTIYNLSGYVKLESIWRSVAMIVDINHDDMEDVAIGDPYW